MTTYASETPLTAKRPPCSAHARSPRPGTSTVAAARPAALDLHRSAVGASHHVTSLESTTGHGWQCRSRLDCLARWWASCITDAGPPLVRRGSNHSSSSRCSHFSYATHHTMAAHLGLEPRCGQVWTLIRVRAVRRTANACAGIARAGCDPHHPA